MAFVYLFMACIRQKQPVKPTRFAETILTSIDLHILCTVSSGIILILVFLVDFSRTMLYTNAVFAVVSCLSVCPSHPLLCHNSFTYRPNFFTVC